MQVGREQSVSALGKVWRLPPLEINILDRFLEWVRPQIADPIDRLAKVIDKLPPGLAEGEYVKAKREAEGIDALDWDSPHLERFQKTKRGTAHLFLFLLQVHQPHATLADVLNIVAEIGPVEFAKVIEVASGQVPAKNGQAPAQAGDRGRTGQLSTAT